MLPMPNNMLDDVENIACSELLKDSKDSESSVEFYKVTDSEGTYTWAVIGDDAYRLDEDGVCGPFTGQGYQVREVRKNRAVTYTLGP